ncbi:hypothetical protein ABTK14_22415, partial [Acinetobacter baumannii]
SVRLYADISGAKNYEWHLGNGKVIRTSSNSIYESYFTPSDSLTIKVLAISERNCKNWFSNTIKVMPKPIDTLVNHSFMGRVKNW